MRLYLSGRVVPAKPTNFDTYDASGISFFQYYIGDAQAASGDFGRLLSVGSFDFSIETDVLVEKKRSRAGRPRHTSAPNATNGPHFGCKSPNPPFVRTTPELFSNAICVCSLRSCSYSICQPCYELIPAQMATVNRRPQLTSQCPVIDCDEKMKRAVAWPSALDHVPLKALYEDTRLPIRAESEAGRNSGRRRVMER